MQRQDCRIASSPTESVAANGTSPRAPTRIATLHRTRKPDRVKALILLLVGIFVGVFCTLAATKTMAKRNAHGRAVMVSLARHMGELRSADPQGDCSAPPIRMHLAQVDAAARDLDFAFGSLFGGDPAFARRSAHFQSLARTAVAADCQALPAAIGQLADDCQACHRQFR